LSLQHKVYSKVRYMKRTAQAHWQGNLKEGKGTLTTQSGVLTRTNYSFKTRFGEGEKGTNPEELLAAAHAGCFTLAVASYITARGLNQSTLDTEATVTLEGTEITGVHIAITGSVQGLTPNEFLSITKDAEKNCIISKALHVPVTSEAHFIVEKEPASIE